MAWTEKPPTAIVALGDLAPLLRTESAKILAFGYARLLAASDGAIPSKASLDLAPIARMLADAALLAIEAPDRCVYRLVGENLKNRVGFDPTGLNYYDLVPEIRRSYAMRAMNMVIGRPMGFRADIAQIYSSGEALTIESLGLPLASAEQGVAGFILFADEAQSRWDRRIAEGTRLLGANVVRRDLVDIGFGTDADFRDLVET
ncbi:MAG: PAS domain-containing protein [Telmatospirillum sp.]|nr:PAS domain-containing protein [Telmatospirillum sp.]